MFVLSAAWNDRERGAVANPDSADDPVRNDLRDPAPGPGDPQPLPSSPRLPGDTARIDGTPVPGEERILGLERGRLAEDDSIGRVESMKGVHAELVVRITPSVAADAIRRAATSI